MQFVNLIPYLYPSLILEGKGACFKDNCSIYHVYIGVSKFNIVDDITMKMSNMVVKEDPPFKCVLCGATYKADYTLEKHLQEKHGEEKKLFKCNECDQILKTKRNLENHVTTKHRTCKECRLVLGSKDELDHHKKEHTTCNICKGDFKIKSKLERHMKTHQ